MPAKKNTTTGEPDPQEQIAAAKAAHRPSVSSYDQGWNEALTWVEDLLYPQPTHEEEPAPDDSEPFAATS